MSSFLLSSFIDGNEQIEFNLLQSVCGGGDQFIACVMRLNHSIWCDLSRCEEFLFSFRRMKSLEKKTTKNENDFLLTSVSQFCFRNEKKFCLPLHGAQKHWSQINEIDGLLPPPKTLHVQRTSLSICGFVLCERIIIRRFFFQLVNCQIWAWAFSLNERGWKGRTEDNRNGIKLKHIHGTFNSKSKN